MNQKYSIYTAALFLVTIGCSTTGTVSTNDSHNRTNSVEKAQRYVDMGNEYAKRSEFYYAKRNFLNAAELDPGDYKNWALAGMAAKDNSDFDEAIGYFHKASELNPTDYKAYGQIGVINKRLKKYEDAVSAFKTVLTLNGTDLESAASLAEIYYEMSDYVQCEQYMARFEENLSKKNVSLLSDQTKKTIEKTLNAFANYRTVIKGKSSNDQ